MSVHCSQAAENRFHYDDAICKPGFSFWNCGSVSLSFASHPFAFFGASEKLFL